jgi:hypothetical protein
VDICKYYLKCSCLRFEIFTAATMKNAAFRNVAPGRSCVNRRFGGTYHLHLHGRKIRERGTSVCMWLQTELSRFTQHLHGATSQKTAFLKCSCFTEHKCLCITKTKQVMFKKTIDVCCEIHTFGQNEDSLRSKQVIHKIYSFLCALKT